MNKRSLMVMVLIGLLGFGMIFAGCENGSTPNDDDKKEEDVVERVVAEKYRGRWVVENDDTRFIILTKDTAQVQTHNPTPAWTVDNKAFWDDDERGYFSDENTLQYTPGGDLVYTLKKQP